MEVARSPICWTLLIGINLYPDNNKTEPLKGYIRDIEVIEHYLKDNLNINIIVLKANINNNRDLRRSSKLED